MSLERRISDLHSDVEKKDREIAQLKTAIKGKCPLLHDFYYLVYIFVACYVYLLLGLWYACTV